MPGNAFDTASDEGGVEPGAAVGGSRGWSTDTARSILVHYEGYKPECTEWISVLSPRLAPFRTHTSRPLSIHMQAVQQVVKGASAR